MTNTKLRNTCTNILLTDTRSYFRKPVGPCGTALPPTIRIRHRLLQYRLRLHPKDRDIVRGPRVRFARGRIPKSLVRPHRTSLPSPMLRLHLLLRHVHLNDQDRRGGRLPRPLVASSLVRPLRGTHRRCLFLRTTSAPAWTCFWKYYIAGFCFWKIVIHSSDVRIHKIHK